MSFRSWWPVRHRDQDRFSSSILTGGSEQRRRPAVPPAFPSASVFIRVRRTDLHAAVHWTSTRNMASHLHLSDSTAWKDTPDELMIQRALTRDARGT